MIDKEQMDNWNNMTVKYQDDPNYEWAISKVVGAEVEVYIDPAQGYTYDPYEQRRNEVPHSKAASCDPYDGAPPVDDAYKQDFSHKYARRYNDRGVMSMVREFAEVMGQEPSALRSLDLVYEEYEEFREADNPKDDLKELADLVYVLYGYANAQGYDLDEALRRVHKNNLDRCVQEDGTVQYNEIGKVLKRKDAPKVKLDDLV